MNEPPPKPVSEVWRPELTRLPRLTLPRRAFRAFAHGLIKLTARVCLDVSIEGSENIPGRGPLLVVINHLGDSDAVAIVSALPRPPDALGKVELYDYGVLGRLMDWYGVIWLHRGRPDKRALRAALNGLAEGRVVVIAPEGRYSLTGALETGSGGAAFLALKSGVPILPIVVTGTENEKVYGSLKKLRRAAVRLKAGKMFRLAGQVEGDALRLSKDRREAMDEGTRKIMRALADLLPDEYRGAYAS
jgi:1-acyl-sn-glycerol-3-phosphate acyltransferase